MKVAILAGGLGSSGKKTCLRLEIVVGLNALPMEAMILISEDSKVQKLASFHRKGTLSAPYFDHLEHKVD
jgi:hypothetical protein